MYNQHLNYQHYRSPNRDAINYQLMKKSVAPTRNPLGSIFCNIFGHHYTVSKKVTKHIKEYKCAHCKKRVTTDVGGKLSELTPKRKEINDALLDMYQKRNRRSRKERRHVA